MVRGRDRQLWWHTAATLAVLVNCHRDPKKPAVSARDLHPYYNRAGGAGMPVNKETMSAFAAMFVAPDKARAVEARVRHEQSLVAEMAARQRLRLFRGAA